MFSSYSQNEINYKLIDSLGRNFTNRLKDSNIEYLKNSKPAKGTYTYNRLVEFKESLENYPNEIIIGSFIEPSSNSTLFGFNLFAYRRVDNRSFEYYFAAVVSIDISNDSYVVDGSYLFTEQESLKSWWMHIFGFYESEVKKQIPKELVFPVCPPPPFREK